MKHVIIIGASHTGVAIAKRIRGHKSVTCFLMDTCPCPDLAVFDQYREIQVVDPADHKADAYFVVYDDDAANVRTILKIRERNPEVKIYTVMSQPSLAAKLWKRIHNVTCVNQAELAARKFVESIYQEDDSQSAEPVKPTFSLDKFKMDPLIRKALVFIGSLLGFSVTFFMLHSGMKIVDAFYFTITMMTTVGFGDYSLKDEGNVAKIVGSLVMVASVISVSLIFALINDTVIRKRKELTHGITKYRGTGHVIVIGAGSVGYRVVAELMSRGEHPVLIDKTMEGRFALDLLQLKVPFILGDATNEKLLVQANVAEAKAVIAVTQHDLVNLEVGLDTKNMHPEKRVVLRIYDQRLSASLKSNQIIRHSYSMSSIAADHLIGSMEEDNQIEAAKVDSLYRL